MLRPPFLAAALLLVAPIPASGADWPQFNLDAQHSGTSQQETVIHHGNVATLHVRYHVALPGVADGAPAFLADVTTPLGVKDVLFLTTRNGWIVACDAATGGVVWSHQPATGPNYTTSMPAVDPGRQYVYSYGLEGRVHKYQVGDGTEITTGGWPQVATLKPSVEKSSPGLAVAIARDGTPYLYVANGGYPGDAGDYQGHVTTINLTTGAQRVFNANCSDQTVHFTLGGSPDCPAVQTAIWARAGVVYDADNDRIYMATGNGPFDANVGGHNWGDSVFALHPDGTGTGGSPVDSYTPVEFQQLENTDLDLGSTAPALFPPLSGSAVAHIGVQSGKDAQLRLLDMDNLSGMGAPGHVGGELQKLPVPLGGLVLTAPAVWQNPAGGGIWALVASHLGISGFELTLGSGGAPLLALRWANGNGGTSPIVVNGILFYASYTGMRALDPVTGTQLWFDASIGTIHWESPIVVNGRLYVTDEAGNLWAFEPNPVGDFNGDGKPDIVWRNTVTGDDAIWYMGGAGGLTMIGAGTFSSAPTNWSIVGAGDFNRDGKTDIVWRNTATGDDAIWYMGGAGGTTMIGAGAFTSAPTSWSIAGVRDFNGDGTPDIVWRNTATGDDAIWYMGGAGGTTMIGTAAFMSAPTNWSIVGVEDFNGDGKPDIVWRNTVTGENAISFMGGAGGTTVLGGGPFASAPTSWSIVGVGDLNGDGSPDIVWRNTSTGDDAIWFMNGTTVISAGAFTPAPPSWTIVGP